MDKTDTRTYGSLFRVPGGVSGFWEGVFREWRAGFSLGLLLVASAAFPVRCFVGIAFVPAPGRCVRAGFRGSGFSGVLAEAGWAGLVRGVGGTRGSGCFLLPGASRVVCG